MEQQKEKSCRFIGRILELKFDPHGVKFLSIKNTKNDSDYIYTYPNIDYIDENVEMKQEMRKLPPLKELCRGAFPVDISFKDLYDLLNFHIIFSIVI